jgi:hypothetical protein
MPASATFDDVSSLFNSQDLPLQVVAQTGDDWKLCGEGVFSWSVFKFYRIRCHAAPPLRLIVFTPVIRAANYYDFPARNSAIGGTDTSTAGKLAQRPRGNRA